MGYFLPFFCFCREIGEAQRTRTEIVASLASRPTLVAAETQSSSPHKSKLDDLHGFPMSKVKDIQRVEVLGESYLAIFCFFRERVLLVLKCLSLNAMVSQCSAQ